MWGGGVLMPTAGMTSPATLVNAYTIPDFETALLGMKYTSAGLFFDTTARSLTLFYNTSQTNARSIWTALLGGAARQAFGAGGTARTTVWWEPFPTLTTAQRSREFARAQSSGHS